MVRLFIYLSLNKTLISVCLEMLPSLDNFISFGSEMIKSRPDYIQMLLDIYTTSLTNEQLGENDKINGSKLAESMLLNLRGCLNDVCFFLVGTLMVFLNFHCIVPSGYHHSFVWLVQYCSRHSITTCQSRSVDKRNIIQSGLILTHHGITSSTFFLFHRYLVVTIRLLLCSNHALLYFTNQDVLRQMVRGDK